MRCTKRILKFLDASPGTSRHGHVPVHKPHCMHQYNVSAPDATIASLTSRKGTLASMIHPLSSGILCHNLKHYGGAGTVIVRGFLTGW